MIYREFATSEITDLKTTDLMMFHLLDHEGQCKVIRVGQTPSQPGDDLFTFDPTVPVDLLTFQPRALGRGPPSGHGQRGQRGAPGHGPKTFTVLSDTSDQNRRLDLPGGIMFFRGCGRDQQFYDFLDARGRMTFGVWIRYVALIIIHRIHYNTDLNIRIPDVHMMSELLVYQDEKKERIGPDHAASRDNIISRENWPGDLASGSSRAQRWAFSHEPNDVNHLEIGAPMMSTT